jgi:hypothetical protein
VLDTSAGTEQGIDLSMLPLADVTTADIAGSIVTAAVGTLPIEAVSSIPLPSEVAEVLTVAADEAFKAA